MQEKVVFFIPNHPAKPPMTLRHKNHLVSCSWRWENSRVGLQKCLQVSSQIPTGVTQTAAGSLPPPPPPSADVIWHVWYKCQPRTYLAQTFPATSCRAAAVTQPCTFILTLLPLNSPINQCAYLINFSNNNKKNNNPVIITVKSAEVMCAWLPLRR